MLAFLTLAAALATLLSGAHAKSTGTTFALGAGGLGHTVAAAAFVFLALAGVATARGRRSAYLQTVGAAGLAVALTTDLTPRPAAIAHAALGLIALACATRIAGSALLPQQACDAHRAAHRRFAYMTAALLACTLVQIVLGAAVRHLGAGLSIPDFPLAMGKLIPPLTSPYVAVHFAHRVWGMVVVTLAGVVSGVGSVDLAHHAAIGRVSRSLAAVTALQVGIGAYVIWWERAVVTTVAHVVNGGLALALSWWLTAMAWETYSGVASNTLKPQAGKSM